MNLGAGSKSFLSLLQGSREILIQGVVQASNESWVLHPVTGTGDRHTGILEIIMELQKYGLRFQFFLHVVLLPREANALQYRKTPRTWCSLSTTPSLRRIVLSGNLSYQERPLKCQVVGLLAEGGRIVYSCISTCVRVYVCTHVYLAKLRCNSHNLRQISPHGYPYPNSKNQLMPQTEPYL